MIDLVTIIEVPGLGNHGNCRADRSTFLYCVVTDKINTALHVGIVRAECKEVLCYVGTATTVTALHVRNVLHREFNHATLITLPFIPFGYKWFYGFTLFDGTLL